MTALYLAWRQPERGWWPVGRLTRQGNEYVFQYTKGAVEAAKAGFRPLLSFPDLSTPYISSELFPLFANRVPPFSRPDYGDFVQWLDLDPEERDPLVLLARSGGQRETDIFEVVPVPEPTADGKYQVAFFVRGLQFRPPDVHAETLRLAAGDPLLLEPEPENPHDALAVRVHSGRRTHLGFVPRYLAPDIHRLREAGVELSTVVRLVNPPPTPMQFRLLSQVSGAWPDGFAPLSAPDFEPLQTLVPAHE